jgi:hypothetical protein
MSDKRTTFERLSYAINQLMDAIDETIETDRAKQMRVRSYLIKALYWLDRYMSERYFEEKANEEKEEKPKIKPKKKR